MKNELTFALITGASCGLGKHYAIELAKRGNNVLLVAKKNEDLPQLSEFITKTYNVASFYFETDLTNIHSLEKMIIWVNSSYSVNILINNVGAGGTAKFEQVSPNYINNIIQLNIRALTYITHQLLPNLKATKKPSFVLNVSSMAAFCPMGYKTVYPASKKYIQFFSEGLNYELHDKNVTVATVFPGPMKTNAEVSERIEKQGFMIKKLLVTPKIVAKVSLEKLFSGKTFIIVGMANKINYLLLKIVPTSLIVPLLAKTFKKELTDNSISYESAFNHSRI